MKYHVLETVGRTGTKGQRKKISTGDGAERKQILFIVLPATVGPTRIATRWSKIYRASILGVGPILALPRMLYTVDALT
jgi:hypothetical protein